MSFVTGIIQDLRFALRQLRRAPGFAATGVLTLALAIAAACVMFSVVRSTLLEPLPYPVPEQLAGIGLEQPGGTPDARQTGATAQFLKQNARAFHSFGLADGGASETNFAAGNNRAASARALRIDADFLPTLGVAPLLGRSFTQAEDTPGSGAVVLLSEALWRGSLGGDPGVLGRVVRVDGDPATVVGVMPASFATADAPDLWQPLRLSPKNPGYDGRNYQLVARLRAGITLAQANAELQTLEPALFHAIPHMQQYTVPGAPPVIEFAWPLQAVAAAEARPGIVTLSAAVGVVLLIACLNLAALMTARVAARRSELALRAALGAGRGSLLRSMLGESLVLAVSGGLLGLSLAYALLPVLLHDAPLELPKLHSAVVDLRTCLFALAISLFATLFFGLLPAWSMLRTRSVAPLGNGRTVGDTAPRQRLGRALLAAQVALATALLASAFVLLGTFAHLRARTPGLQPAHLDVLQVQLKGERYTSAARTAQFINILTQKLAALPGVGTAAAAYGLPLERGLNDSAGPANRRDLIKYAEIRYITPGYLRTVGTPLLSGADLPASVSSTTQPVALINKLAAQRWFNGSAQALDRLVMEGGGKPLRVLGIVAPVHVASLADTQAPTMYEPIAQIDDATAKTINGWFPVSFVLRLQSSGNGEDPALAQAAAAAVRDLDPDVAVSKFIPMQGLVERSYAAPRFFSWLAGGFAAFSLLLTIIGLFGLLSYQVASRTREIGVRMAVGASRLQIAGLVVRRGFLLTAFGLLTGIVLGVVLQSSLLSFIASTLNVSLAEARSVLPGRVLPLLTTTLAMLLTAAAACLLPARRAAGVQPIEALRAE